MSFQLELLKAECKLLLTEYEKDSPILDKIRDLELLKTWLQTGRSLAGYYTLECRYETSAIREIIKLL